MEQRRPQKLNCVSSTLFVHRDEINRDHSRKRNEQTQIGSRESFREVNGLMTRQIYRPVTSESNQYSEEPVALIGHGGFCEGPTPLSIERG